MRYVRRIVFLPFLTLPLWGFDTPIGEFRTHIEFFHYDINTIETGSENDAYATALGGFLSYRSVPVMDHFGMGYTQYLSHLIFSEQNPCKTLLCDGAGHDINPMAELYLYYSDDHVDVTAGRQQLDTPLINDDTTRLIPYSYEAITAKVRFDRDTILSLGHVSGFRTNTSEEYTDESSSGYARSGVSYIGLNTAFGNVKHQWYYYHADGLYDALHTEVSTKTPYDSSRDLLYGVQAIYTFNGGENISNRSNGGDDVRLIAAKLGIANDRYEWIGSLSYNFGDDGISRAYGGLASVYTTSMITGGKDVGNPFAKSLKITYNYDSATRKNAYTSSLHLTNVTYDDPALHDTNAIYIDHRFNFRPREYIFLRFERQWIDGAADRSYFRIISAYEF